MSFVCPIIGEMGVGKASLFELLENGSFTGEKEAKQTEGKAIVIDTRKKKGKKFEFNFFKLQPDLANHGSGWEDKSVIARLADQKKGEVINAVVFCIPARTYAARHKSVCDEKSIESWLTCIQKNCPDAPIVIVRTKVDLEGAEQLKNAGLGFSTEQAAALVKTYPLVCGVVDCSAKEGTGMDTFYDDVGKLIIAEQPSGHCVIL